MQDIGPAPIGRSHLTVLVMVPEPVVRDVIAINLRDAGFHPVAADSFDAGRRLIAEVLPDAFVLDLDATDTGGLSLLRDLQASAGGGDLPVLCLTSAHGRERKECSAHDCLAKPFSPMDLVARLADLVGRHNGRLRPAVVQVGPLELDAAQYTITVHGAGGAEALHAPAAEFRLLHYLMSAPDRVHTRNQLAAEVWRGHASVHPRTVDQNIKRLRTNLGAVGLADLIETVRGVGYRLRTAPVRRAARP